MVRWIIMDKTLLIFIIGLQPVKFNTVYVFTVYLLFFLVNLYKYRSWGGLRLFYFFSFEMVLCFIFLFFTPSNTAYLDTGGAADSKNTRSRATLYSDLLLNSIVLVLIKFLFLHIDAKKVHYYYLLST